MWSYTRNRNPQCPTPVLANQVTGLFSWTLFLWESPRFLPSPKLPDRISHITYQISRGKNGGTIIVQCFTFGSKQVFFLEKFVHLSIHPHTDSLVLSFQCNREKAPFVGSFSKLPQWLGLDWFEGDAGNAILVSHVRGRDSATWPPPLPLGQEARTGIWKLVLTPGSPKQSRVYLVSYLQGPEPISTVFWLIQSLVQCWTCMIHPIHDVLSSIDAVSLLSIWQIRNA